MAHIISPEAEELLDKELKVPSNGFVRLVDYMGSDQSIVQAARVSYGEGTKTVREDRGLIRYLMRHQHSTPFEMVVLKFHIKAPIFVIRQWMRHRTACLAGDTLLHFDLPAAFAKGRRHIFKVTIQDFHRMWYQGTRHSTGGKRKPLFLDRIEPGRMYTVPELARLVERREEDLRRRISSNHLQAVRVQAGPRDPKLLIKGSAWHKYALSAFTTQVPMRDRLSKMRLRMCNEETGEIEHTSVVDVWQNGEKDVFRVTLENGYSIKMTSDHRCLTEKGWMTLGQATGLRISRRGNVNWDADAPALAVNGALVPARTRRAITKRPYSEEGLARVRAARCGPNSNFWKGGVTSERANIGRWTREQAPFVHARYGYKCAICGSKRELEAHHVDPVWHNPSRARDFENLMSLCNTCHGALHSRNLELDFLEVVQAGRDLATFFDNRGARPWLADKPRPRPVRLVRTFSRVARIEYAGREMTYDLEVAGPYHNFAANGFIVHNSINEESGRYSIMREGFHEPAWEDVGFQSKNNRQGRASEEVPRELVERFMAFLKEDRETAYAHYETFLQDNVARELARIVLPLSLYSQFYWEMNLHNLFHFLWLRMDDHAQKEIRDYANQVAVCVKAVAPIAWEAFEEYKLYARSFSRTELDILKRLLQGEPLPPDAFDGSKSLLREFESKLGMQFNAPELPSPLNGSK